MIIIAVGYAKVVFGPSLTMLRYVSTEKGPSLLVHQTISRLVLPACGFGGFLIWIHLSVLLLLCAKTQTQADPWWQLQHALRNQACYYIYI